MADIKAIYGHDSRRDGEYASIAARAVAEVHYKKEV